MDVSVEKTATLRAQEHGHQPCVMQPACAGFSAGQGKKAGSIGFQHECAPTIRGSASGSNMAPSICFYPKITGTLCGSGAGTSRTAGNCNEVDLAICIAGNTIDRDVKNGGNGIGALENTSYTLNTVDKHAVCAFDPTQVTSPVNRSQPGFDKPCHTLSANASAPGVIIGDDSEDGLITGNKTTGTLMANCATKQFLGNQEAFSGEYFIKSNAQLRRLLPIECGRLQGFPDWWCTDVPHSDAAEYKMWGNGVALPCVLYVMQGIALHAK